MLQEARMVFLRTQPSVAKSDDYHKEMNSRHFQEWWFEKVLPNLPDKSVIVTDNAPSHSKQTDESKKPNTRWRKASIQNWLTEKNANFDKEADTIPLLLQKVNFVPVPKEFELKRITRKFCEENNRTVTVLRLPAAHSELNAIELIWALCEGEVARKNTTFKMADVKRLMEDFLG